MASASGGGADLSKILKCISTTSNCQLNKSDLEELIALINKRETDLFHHDSDYNTFYTTMAALSAECLSASAYSLCKTQFGAACKASKILLKYLLQTLCSSHSSKEQALPTGLTSKQLLLPIKSLCSAQPLLPTSDRVALQTLLKDVKIHLTKPDLTVPAKDSKKPRASFNAAFIDHLTTPLFDFSSAPSSENLAKNSETGHDIASGKDIEALFIKTNIETLQSLKAGEVLISLCLESPYLVRYVKKYRENISSGKFTLPTTGSEANSILRHNVQALANDIYLVWGALSLPIFEPLDNARLERLTELTMSCLYCALYVAAANSMASTTTAVSPKCLASSNSASNVSLNNASTIPNPPRQSTSEDDQFHDSIATAIVEKTLQIHKMISEMIGSSARAGGNILQNYRLISVWVLLSNLQGQFSVVNVHPPEKPKEDKAKTSVKVRESNVRVSFVKVQHGFGVLTVALSSLCLDLMTSLLDEVVVECAGMEVSCVQPETPTTLSILNKYTALERAAKFLSVAPVCQILFNLTAISSRKAYALKRVPKSPTSHSTGTDSPAITSSAFSDSTVYFEDDMMSLEFSSTDDDEDDEEVEEDDDDEESDRILGQWFEETLAPPTTVSAAISENRAGGNEGEAAAGEGKAAKSGLVPDKSEPHGYIILATKVFQFMNKHFLNQRSPYLWSHIKSSITEQQMIILAAIIRDLDRETARTETGTIPAFFGSILGGLYSEFSQALTRFTHNLLVSEMLNDHLKATLLTHLGVNPWQDEVRSWPLQVHARNLAVLAQVLLLTQDPQEKERATIEIWHRLVNELKLNILHPTQETDFDDLNVEHAQLVLFFFYSLNLMQKKSSLMYTASCIVDIVDELFDKQLKDSQILHLSRLLLLLEYLMRHLYDAPSVLAEQIQWNLSTATTMIGESPETKESSKMPSRIFCPWKDIEDNYRKHVSPDDLTMKPRFYSLTNIEISNQEQPKLDGLACNFLLGTPEKLKYPKFLKTLIRILNITDKARWSPGLSLTGYCAVQYCFSITWRFLLLLPPSSQYLECLARGEEPATATDILYTIVWGPRTGYKTFTHWIKDCLVRQSIQVQYAEALLKNVTKVVTTLSFDISLAKCFIGRVMVAIEKGEQPSVTDLCTLDAIIAKIQVLMDESIAKTPDAIEKSSSPIESAPASSKLVETILPDIISVAFQVLDCCRSNLLEEIMNSNKVNEAVTSDDKKIYREVLSLASRWDPKMSGLGNVMNIVPPHVRSIAEKWDLNSISEFPWNTYANDIIPAESYVLAVVNTHVSSIASQGFYNSNASMQHLLSSIVTFISEQITKCTENLEAIQDRALDLLVSMTMERCSQFLHTSIQRALEKINADRENETHMQKIHYHVLKHTCRLICIDSSSSVLDGCLKSCLQYLEEIVDNPLAAKTFHEFFITHKKCDLVTIMLSSALENRSNQYSSMVYKFFVKLFTTGDKLPGDLCLDTLCKSLSRLTTVDRETLRKWLRYLILGDPSNGTSSSASTPVQSEPASESSVSNNVAVSKDVKEGSNQAQKSNQNTKEEDNKNNKIENNESVVEDNNKESENHQQANHLLLQSLTNYLTKDPGGKGQEMAKTLLEAMIPIGDEVLRKMNGVGFCDLMPVMTSLANTGQCYVLLVNAAIDWLQIIKEGLPEDVTVASAWSDAKQRTMFDAGVHLLQFVADVVAALTPSPGAPPSGIRANSPLWEADALVDFDYDGMDEAGAVGLDDEDSAGEDSDEDNLCNRLCTFTITAKEFMNQHWYHCHTCGMVESVGVCTVCARVCHRGHDITYAKYGNFFCDCGAKADGSCQALRQRSPQVLQAGGSGAGPMGSAAGASDSQQQQAGANAVTGCVSGLEQLLPSSLRRRPSSPACTGAGIMDRGGKDRGRIAALTKAIDLSREQLLGVFTNSNVVMLLLELVSSLLPVMKAACDGLSPVGCHERALAEMNKLHALEKTFEESDQLMLPTLGSQEGAFENVKMNYSGEQGQMIRQLVSSHMIRRVAMCCLSSPQGKRQHLAVSHEKGKITVLQLSALLKQADSSKRKLTLTRLASAPISFTVLSMTGNPCNEDFLAVCGLKECHVVTFTSGGLVSDHLVLHPMLETGNFIIKAIWLPGSQTELALVTADFIKVYDLSVDAVNPKYFFLVPAGKVRDCTFYCNESYKYNYILVMTSAGYICMQEMSDDTLAVNGPFFMMDLLENYHEEVKESQGQVEGGGVSIYYSHALQLLFFSYSSGKSFVAPLTTIDKGYKGLPKMFLITWGANKISSNASNGAGKSNNAPAQPQPLCQWSEVPNHPGLVFSVMMSSNNPVVLMVRPDRILVQEIKVMPAKAKIVDMVAIRHPSSNSEHRTTLILLCEDGSLRIYMASMQHTGFWMSPTVQALSTSSGKHPRKRKANANQSGKPSGNLTFPVDFFEHCQVMNDVEFGGNDLLQVYNTNQIKHRLNTPNMNVVSSKQAGFSVEITNNDPSLVMTGIRVSVSNVQEPHRTPAYIEIFGRSIHTVSAVNRWFDLPFTREESLQADKKITITFGPSQDPDCITTMDSIKVYGKTKDAFGWPDDTEEVTNNLNGPSSATTSSSNVGGENSLLSPNNSMEKIISGLLEVLEGCFSLTWNSQMEPTKLQQQQRNAALTTATSLITLPTSSSMQLHAKSLLAALFPTKFAFHYYKDTELLRNAFKTLNSFVAETDAKKIDPEAFYRLVLTVRSIAVPRPYNLTKFPELFLTELPSPNKDQNGQKKSPKGQFISDLISTLWRLLDCAPKNSARAPVCKPGLTHTEAVVQAIVEILHAFTLCDSEGTMTETAECYTQMLLSDNLMISFNAKQALIRVLRPRMKRRRVFIPSPPRGTSPGNDGAKGLINQPSQDLSDPEHQSYDSQTADPLILLPADEEEDDDDDPTGEPGAAAAALDAILGGAMPPGVFPPIIDIPPDADDETMVELAIALSLQEGGMLEGIRGSGSRVVGGSVGGSVRREVAAAAASAGHYSDTTASAAGSDEDEGSTAATDGSTLRTSPAEPAQGGSESGGSGVESIVGEQNVSGRSSAYGDSQEPSTGNVRADPTTSAVHENENETDVYSSLHQLRLTILQQLIYRIPNLQNHDGVHIVPFMQVLLTLTSDLDGVEDKDEVVLENLLRCLDIKQPVDVAVRNPKREVHLVILRFLSVLMSRSKNSMKSSFVSSTTAQFLLNASVIGYCYDLLENMLKYWKASGTEVEATSNGGALLKPHLTSSPPDMSPFFLRQYVKGHANDVFEDYPQLLTEMALRLPYQIQKHLDSTSTIQNNFRSSWYSSLCEFMRTNQAPFVRRQVRKLLMYLCGHKEKYRHLRDIHSLEFHMKTVIEKCSEKGYSPRDPNCHISLTYVELVELIEHLKECVEVATYRNENWQTFCARNEDTLFTLFELSTLLDEGVCPTILQLLQCALCIKSDNAESASKSEEEDLRGILVHQLNRSVGRVLISKFIRIFLLETNSTSVRWQAHGLILAIYQNSALKNQAHLLDLMWKLWPQLPAYGRRAAQFVDILGYFSLKSAPEGKKATMAEYAQQAVELLRKQNYLLAHHPNASLYLSLAQYVDFDGYYLESEPCFVCNNPEVPMSSIKLSAIKIDSKFTTTSQFVKLVSSHIISKITLRIGDLKRTKMVRTINVYYNNQSAQAVVQLKNKSTVWHKAKKVSLAAGQTEVKMEFLLPIVACNLMIEYADFYENLQVATETLQCPRCSASVPANPGVCGNCGENVFQCHKCRAINYDEKDPFFCHSCGFCKYAKFEYVLTARPCCAVDPIESDEDRNKTVATINSSLEKADRVYRSIAANKPCLEMFIMKINEPPEDKTIDAASGAINATMAITGSSGSQHVSKIIQLLAQRYCGECKNSFDELSKLIQKVVASRRELVAYDRDQREKGKRGSYSSPNITPNWQGSMVGRCYGCATSASDHCLTMLRALATSPSLRQLLCQEGLIEELVKNNLRKGTQNVQDLLCLLTRDNVKATQDLCALLMDRILLVLRGHVSNSELVSAVRYEMSLLAALVEKEDTFWENKIKCVMSLLFAANQHADDPAVLRWITLPCQEILYNMMRPLQPTSKKNKDKTLDQLASVRPQEDVRIDVQRWMQGDPCHSYATWLKRMPVAESTDTVSVEDAAQAQAKKPQQSMLSPRVLYLMERYGTRWRRKTLKSASMSITLIKDAPWLKRALFNASSPRLARTACLIIESLWMVSARKKEIMDLLTGYLGELGQAGESAARFINLFQTLLKQPPWKQYLVVKGILLKIADLLTQEIEAIHRLEDTSLTSDLAQGYALKILTELLASFLDHDGIKQLYKGRLVGAVLNGYLSLRRLVVQRTRLIDETQDKLLELLEEMTSGTEEETKAFMAICIETAKKQDLEDIRTPVFIFERLCSIIYPEENDTSEFFLTLDKDPQQEDFLQGRMLGNPYSSNEPGMGPLMRDIKNKICQDCELVALLEDDNGMELLVNNKIISLNLPVRDVWKKIWCTEGGDNDTMRIVYRMRGLLGDATEEFVETVNSKIVTEVDNEEVYKMANVMAECGGLQVMLERMSQITDLTRARPLLQVLLKLFRLCVKVKKNQEVLIQPELNAINVFLDVLQKLCSSKESSASQVAITEQLLEIMETILSKATSESAEKFYQFSKTFGGVTHIEALLTFTTSSNGSSAVLPHLMRVLSALTYGNEERMGALMSHFTPLLDFNAFDAEHPSEVEAKMELFCELTKSIERNAIGSTLKDYINSLNIVERALEYFETHAPPIEVCRTESDDWKEFISKPSLKYILRFLTGLATGHERTQLAVAAKSIRIIHQLEQVSTDDHVGSLAENLLEALKTDNLVVAEQIENVRKETRAEKKRRAMAMRERQLGVLGMRTNDKGQVTADSTIMQQVEDLGEETGHVCVICREGYKFQPQKVLGIYTFTKRCNVDEYEAKPRKTIGYTTVTHFNIVHVDCHMAAVRLARTRDEWESAALQNANTKCNGLLPLWGPQVPESAYASCLARHNTYLQDCTGHRDISYNSMVHDLKLLLSRFAQERSFHDDTGGGGPQSNMYIIPYLLHMALYVINSTRSAPREEKTLTQNLFEQRAVEKWVESAYEAEGPLYSAVMCLLLVSPQRWPRIRLTLLTRLLVIAHVRHVSPSAPPSGNRLPRQDAVVRDWAVYKWAGVFFALIHGWYRVFQKVSVSSEEQWPSQLADYIRHNDEALMKASDKLLSAYRDDYLPCSSFEEFCDVLDFLEEIPEPARYFSEIISSLSFSYD